MKIDFVLLGKIGLILLLILIILITIYFVVLFKKAKPILMIGEAEAETETEAETEAVESPTPLGARNRSRSTYRSSRKPIDKLATESEAEAEEMRKIMNLSENDPEYYVNQLTKAIKQSVNKKYKSDKHREQLIGAICNKFEQLNQSCNKNHHGFLLVDHLKPYVSKQYPDNIDIDENDLTSILDAHENLIFIIYPELLEE